MTILSTRLFGHNLEYVIEFMLVLHFYVLVVVDKSFSSLSDFLRIKRKELLKKRLLQGEEALAYDCFHLLKKMLPVQHM